MLEGARVDGGDLKEAENDHVDNHGPLASPLVSGQTEDSGTNGAKQQGEGNRSRDISVAAVVVLGQFGRLDREGVEVEGISTPSAESDDEEKPVFGAELGQQAEGVLQRLWGLPFGVLLAIVVCDNDTLLPDEEVTPRLFGSSKGALGERIRGFIGASHNDDQRVMGNEVVENEEGSTTTVRAET